jgi:hypothetical protein
MDRNLEWSWTERRQRADIGAGNGHCNARSVARIQSVLAYGDEVDAIRLLSPKTIGPTSHHYRISNRCRSASNHSGSVCA